MYPFLSLFGLNIPSYGICMTIAIMLCSFLAIKKACKLGVALEDMLILIAISIGMGLFCGGAFYIAVTYSFEDIYFYIRKFDFSFLQNSGLVFYGGLIGGIVGALICSKILNIKIEILEVCTVPYIPLGHAIGRIGCLLAGCCHGFEYKGILAVATRFVSADITYFPIQIVEALLNLLIMLVLLLYTKKKRLKHDVLLCYLIMYSIMRFCLEFFRGDEIRGGFFVFSTSQWISMLIFSFCIVGKYLLYKINKPVTVKNNTF